MTHWYAWIDGRYHITRTNISGCQCECGKELEKGAELREHLAGDEKTCSKCFDIFNPAPIGGPMSLPHYLEAENKRLREIIEDTAIVLEENNLPKSAASLRKHLQEHLTRAGAPK